MFCPPFTDYVAQVTFLERTLLFKCCSCCIQTIECDRISQYNIISFLVLFSTQLVLVRWARLAWDPIRFASQFKVGQVHVPAILALCEVLFNNRKLALHVSAVVYWLRSFWRVFKTTRSALHFEMISHRKCISAAKQHFSRQCRHCTMRSLQARVRFTLSQAAL